MHAQASFSTSNIITSYGNNIKKMHTQPFAIDDHQLAP